MKNLREDIQCMALWSISRDLEASNTSDFSRWTPTVVQSATRPVADADATAASGPMFASFIMADDEIDVRVQASLGALAAGAGVAIELVIAAQPTRIERIRELALPFAGRLTVNVVGCDADYSLAEAEARALAEAHGEFVALMSPGDLVEPTALSQMRRLATALRNRVAVIYADEDWIGDDDTTLMPRLKTGWDPDAQLGLDLPGRLCLMRRQEVLRAGGLRSDNEPAHHYDLHCRLTDLVRPSAIRHIPDILYHRRAPVSRYLPQLDEARACYIAAARDVARQAADRLGVGKVTVRGSHLASFVNQVQWPIPEPAPLVSILIPTRDQPELLRDCVDGVLRERDLPLELLIIDNNSAEPETAALFAELSQDPRVRILHAPGPFNYAKLNNDAAAQARGAILVFMNNDVHAMSAGWLREMVGLALRPDVGCVGAKLLYANRQIQHAGVVLQDGPFAMHVFRNNSMFALGFDGQLAGVRGYSAVTAACLAVRKALFERCGGFAAETFAVAVTDVALCLKIDELGFRNLCTPFATLLHYESASRGLIVAGDDYARSRLEVDFLRAKWSDRFHMDSFHHPMLDMAWDFPTKYVPRSPDAVAPVASR